MADLLEKATSAVTEAKDSVTSTAESVGASLTDAQKTVAASAETVKTEAVASVEAAKTEAAASAETAKTEAEATKANVSTQAKEAVDKALTRGIEGAKALLHTFEEKRTEVSSKLVGAVTNAVGGGASSSTTVASRDLPISTDNQPLLTSSDRGVETTPWWKNCCGVLDLLKTSSTTTTK